MVDTVLSEALTTELDAVNVMLTAFGQRNVQSLTDAASTNQDAAKAIQLLSLTNRQVQSEGWNWNRLREYTLTRDATTGELLLPEGTLKVDTSWCRKYSINAVHVGSRLYDGVNHTFDWTDNGKLIDGLLKVDLVTLRKFEEMPESARWYTAIKAARRMTAGTERQLPFKFTQIDEEEARQWALGDDAVNDDRNLRLYNPHFRRMLKHGRYW